MSFWPGWTLWICDIAFEVLWIISLILFVQRFWALVSCAVSEWLSFGVSYSKTSPAWNFCEFYLLSHVQTRCFREWRWEVCDRCGSLSSLLPRWNGDFFFISLSTWYPYAALPWVTSVRQSDSYNDGNTLHGCKDLSHRPTSKDNTLHVKELTTLILAL